MWPFLPIETMSWEKADDLKMPFAENNILQL